MVDNELIRTSNYVSQGLDKVHLNKNGDIKVPEHLFVTYQIEKIAGFRMNKRTNSFKAALSTSLKSLVQTVIKKVKFSTRYKYAIIYFDTRTGRWKKIKDKCEFLDKTQVKIRVCRYKVSNPKTIVKGNQMGEGQSAEVPEISQIPQINVGPPGQPRFLPFQLNPTMFAYFYTYMVYLNFQRMQNSMQ